MTYRLKQSSPQRIRPMADRRSAIGSKIATLLPMQNPQLDEFMNALIWKAVPVTI
jgi:hypothetical protein